MAKETPLQAVKRQYGGKDKLIDAVVDDAKYDDEDAGEARERLKSVSNSKLLRLARVSAIVREKFGSRDKLIEGLSATLGRARDNDYINKLRTLSSARLLDVMKSAQRRLGRKAS
jgi:hypothetical protein